jgi:hypothetical protein
MFFFTAVTTKSPRMSYSLKRLAQLANPPAHIVAVELQHAPVFAHAADQQMHVLSVL